MLVRKGQGDSLKIEMLIKITSTLLEFDWLVITDIDR